MEGRALPRHWAQHRQPLPRWRPAPWPAGVFLCAALGCGGIQSALAESYDQLCDRIEQQAQLAGYLYNRGQQQEAFAALDASRGSFRDARRLNPADPQAYVSLATALLNSNQLDESLTLWRGALKRTPDDGPTRSWLQGRERWTRYGKVSMRRDRVYAHGQGNVTAALILMDKQLAIYPRSPTLLNDRATAYTMVSGLRGANATAAAVEGFRASHEAAFEAWRAGVQERGRAGPTCDDGGLVYDWQEWYWREPSKRGALQALERAGPATRTSYGPGGVFRDSGSYVARFEDVGLSGTDGVIVDEKHCNIFVASAGPFINLVKNLQLLEIWGDRPSPKADSPQVQWHDYTRGGAPEHGAVSKPKVVKKAASIVQFAAASYFHLVTEVLGRLRLLAEHGVLDDEEVVVIAPNDPKRGGGGVLSHAIRLFLPDVDLKKRFVWWNEGPHDVRLRVQTLYYADWRAPVTLAEDGCHCPTPASLLLGTRRALLASLAPHAPAPSLSRALVFVVRKGASMRSKLKGEKVFRTHLRDVAAEIRIEPPLQLKDFDGTPAPAATAALFSRAHAVVGVHGGGLTNILFCPPDAELFELGFTSALAGHYRHLAAALGLRQTLLPLMADHRGMGSDEVQLADLDAAVGVVRERLLFAAVSSTGASASVATSEL